MERDTLALEPLTTEDRLATAVGKPKQLTEGKGNWHVHNGGWSPDGTRIVYTKDLDTANIYVLEAGSE